LLPIVHRANASFREWSLNDPKKTWWDLTIMPRLLTTPAFLKVVLPNTFVFMVLSVVFALVFGLSLALFVNRPFRGQKKSCTTSCCWPLDMRR